MLLGMSASMAVPNVAVFATENNEETVIETVETAEETIIEEAVEDVIEEVIETEGFAEKLSMVYFSNEVFGDYANALVMFITGDEINKSSLTDAEMSVMDKISEIAAEEIDDVVKAMKYHAALAFETVYGEDAFEAGKSVRKIALGLDEYDTSFDGCEYISDLNNVFINAGGNTMTPVEMKSAAEETAAVEAASLDEDITEGVTENTTGDMTEEETVTDSDTQAIQSLEKYVQNISNIEVKVGEEITFPDLAYDSNYVASVQVDTEKVNTKEPGVYKIVYIINGLDGSTEEIKKQCFVIENEVINEMRDEMMAMIDSLEDGQAITEKKYKEKWEKEVSSAKSQIYSMITRDEMQAVVDEMAAKASSILASQQLNVAQTGYVKLIKEYYASFTWETNTQKSTADSIVKETVAEIESAESIDAASSALEKGKNRLKSVGEQDEASVEELKAKAKASIDKEKSEISDDTSVTETVYNVIVERLEACKNAKEIDSVSNSASLIMRDIKSLMAEDGHLKYFRQMFKDMKGLASDSDTTSAVDQIVALGTPATMEDGEKRTKEVCMAITCSVEDFVKYLSEESGNTLTSTSKAEAYKEYMNIQEIKPNPDTPDDSKDDDNTDNKENPGDTDNDNKDNTDNKENPDDNSDEDGSYAETLEKAKDDAKKSLEERLSAITDSTEKDTLKNKVLALIEESCSLEELEDYIASANSMIDEFLEKTDDDASEKLESAKEKACEEIQKIVNSYEDDEISSLADTAVANIKKADSEEKVSSILAAFKSSVDTIINSKDDNEDDAELTSAKAEVLQKILALESDYDSKYFDDDMKGMIESARAELDAAKTVDECSTIYSRVKQDLNEVYLKNMRTAYEKSLDDLLVTNDFTNGTYLKQAQEVIAKQKENIQSAKNGTVMEQCYQLAKTSVEKLVAAQYSEAELEAAKTDAITRLQAGVENPSSTATKILEKYINKINAATTKDDVDKLVLECQSELEKADIAVKEDEIAKQLKSAKESAITELNSMMDSISDTQKTDADKVLSAYVTKINEAASETSVKTILEEGKSALAVYQSATEAEKALADAKTTAINTVKGYLSSAPTSAETEVMNTYLEKINAATSVDEVTSLVDAAKKSMDEARTQSTVDTDLAKVKSDAVESLKNMLDTVSDSQKAAATEVVNSYINKINAATTVTEVTQLLEEGKTDLQKYGGNPNAAVPNDNTKTTLDENEDATRKYGETETTGLVKTGDMNMGIITLAGTAIVTALAAAYVAIKKLVRH